MPSSGLWEQAQPGWRSAADMQRVEAWRAETNVRREGVGSPEPPRDTCAGCQPAPTWGAQSQVRRGSTRPASAVPNRIASTAPAAFFLRGFLPRSPPPCHPWPRRPDFCAASCRGAVLRNGVTFEEPALTRVAAAGSVVSCDSVLSGAAACGVLQLSQPQSPQSAAPGSSKPESCSTHVTARFSP